MHPTTAVTVSRKWHSPKITTVITRQDISLTMDMDDFIKALKTEIETAGGVTWTFKKATFEAMVDSAVEKILYGIKEEAIKVV
jgi:hypothetical protein